MELPVRTPLPAQAVPVLDRMAHAVAERLKVPIVMVSLVDVDGQVAPGAYGLPEPWASERWTPLTHSFCQHVVVSGAPLVVANAHDDPLVRDNPAVVEAGVIAYAGVPLRLSDSGVAGALCAIDHQPHAWTDADLTELDLSAMACVEELNRL